RSISDSWRRFLLNFEAARSRRCLRILATGIAGPGDRVSHFGVSLNIAQVIIIDDSQMSLPEGVSDCHRDLGFGRNDLGAIFLDGGLHFLLSGDGEGTTLFGLGASDTGVGFRLKGLKVGANVVANVDISDVDRENLVRCSSVEPLLEHAL